MQSQHQVILLVGSDPDVLFLRSAVLASAGIWSLRVRNADQAIAMLGRVACDLVIICYMLNQEDRHQLLHFLRIANSGLKTLCVAPGDDCSGTGFLMKVEDALQELPAAPGCVASFQSAASLG